MQNTPYLVKIQLHPLENPLTLQVLTPFKYLTKKAKDVERDTSPTPTSNTIRSHGMASCWKPLKVGQQTNFLTQFPHPTHSLPEITTYTSLESSALVSTNLAPIPILANYEVQGQFTPIFNSSSPFLELILTLTLPTFEPTANFIDDPNNLEDQTKTLKFPKK